MEIPNYKIEYNKYKNVDFFNWLSKGKIMEIRFLTDREGQKFKSFDIIKLLASKLKCEYRFSSLFIENYKQLLSILYAKYHEEYLTKLFNIFIGVNPRRKVSVKAKNGLIYNSYYGGIAGTECVQTILCDIEYKAKIIGNTTFKQIESCIQGAKHLLKIYELEDYYINISGNGVHLYFSLKEPIDVPIPNFKEHKDKLVYCLKEDPIYTLIKTYNRFIETLNTHLQEYNPNLMVDEGAKDLSRIARPTGSWNVKTGRIPREVGTVLNNKGINYIINNKFTSAKPVLTKETRIIHKRAKPTAKFRHTAADIHLSPLYQLLTTPNLPSTLSRNHYLEQSFARLLRDNNINILDITHLIDKMSDAQMKQVQVDPDYLGDDEPFNPETVISYCVACRIKPIYPILHDIPLVTENLLDTKKIETLEEYSSKAIECVKINFKLKDTYYQTLKSQIRILSETYPKTEIYLSFKEVLHEEWEYFKVIIKDILNKTRIKI
jgi:hypothetical protein